MIRSSPLRFLIFVLIGWTGLRIGWLHIMGREPADVPVMTLAAERAAERDMAWARKAIIPQAAAAPALIPAHDAGLPLIALYAPPAKMRETAQPIAALSSWPAAPLAFSLPAPSPEYGADRNSAHAPQSLPAPPAASAAFAPERPRDNRWFGAAWLLYRPSRADDIFLTNGQLGASQAGARINYDLTPRSDIQLSAYARASSALRRPWGAEVAGGLSLKPTRSWPIVISVEQRVGVVEANKGDVAVFVAGGFGPAPLPLLHAFKLEGYAQTGIVGLKEQAGFADGKLSVAHALPLPVKLPPTTAGFSISGGAQPNLSRLDVGPEVTTRIHLGQDNAPVVRLSLEWRQRVSGNASPGSGITFTIGSDF